MGFPRKKDASPQEEAQKEYHDRYRNRWRSLPKIITAACLAGSVLFYCLGERRDDLAYQRASESYSNHAAGQGVKRIPAAVPGSQAGQQSRLTINDLAGPGAFTIEIRDTSAHAGQYATTPDDTKVEPGHQQSVGDLLAENLQAVQDTVRLIIPDEPAQEPVKQVHETIASYQFATRAKADQQEQTSTRYMLKPKKGEALSTLIHNIIDSSDVVIPKGMIHETIWGGEIDGELYDGLMSSVQDKNGNRLSKPWIIREGEEYVVDLANLPAKFPKNLQPYPLPLEDRIETVQAGSSLSELCADFLQEYVKPKLVLKGFMNDVAIDNNITDMDVILAGSQLRFKAETARKHITAAKAYESTLAGVISAYYPKADESQKQAFQESMDDLSSRALESSRGMKDALKASALSKLDFYTVVNAYARREGVETAQAEKISQYVSQERTIKGFAKRLTAGGKAKDLLTEWNQNNPEQERSLSWLYSHMSKHT